MKIQVLKNETYQSVDNLPTKGTDRATGFDVIVTSEPEIIGEIYDNGAYKRVDYIQYKQTIMLNIKCFKSLCLKAQTKKASEIHEYYMKLEETLHEIVEEGKVKLETKKILGKLVNGKIVDAVGVAKAGMVAPVKKSSSGAAAPAAAAEKKK